MAAAGYIEPLSGSGLETGRGLLCLVEGIHHASNEVHFGFVGLDPVDHFGQFRRDTGDLQVEVGGLGLCFGCLRGECCFGFLCLTEGFFGGAKVGLGLL